MKVVHVITATEIAGAQTMLESVLERLSPEFDCHVISLAPLGPIGERIAARGHPIESLDMRRGVPSVAALVRLVRRLRELRPDVVHTWLYHADLLGGIAARLARVGRVAWGLHNSTLEPAAVRARTRAVVRACALVSHRVPDRILCCSEVARAVHVECGYPAERFAIVPNGLDVDRFRPDPIARQRVRVELGFGADTRLVGLVARWNPQKNHAGFLQAAAEVRRRQPATRFVLAGTGVDEGNAELVALVTSHGLGDAVRLLGPRQDTPRLIAALDVLASASGYGEAFPVVLGEAMACGVPCVATDVGDSAFVIGGTGRVVSPGDMDGLAAAIDELLALPAAERAALSRRARERIVSRFAIDGVARQYEAFYRGLVEAPAVVG